MPFTDVAPPVETSASTGITFSLTVGKKARTARISFNKQAQMDIFGETIIGKKFFAKVGRGQDEGRLLIVQQDDGDLEAKGAMRGSASIRMKAWDLLPHDKRPSKSIELIEPMMGGFLFQLPAWARPNGVGGKMEAEFGLKKPK